MGGEGIPNEVHNDFDELLIVIVGQMHLVVDDKIYYIQAGEYFLVPKGSMHSVQPDSSGSLLLVDAE